MAQQNISFLLIYLGRNECTAACWASEARHALFLYSSYLKNT